MSNQTSILSWIGQMESISIPFQKFGSFLPEQKDLLTIIYEQLENETKSVWVLAAPPSSGKTHVICLVSKVLNDSGEKVAIVVPSNFLKGEFTNACCDVKGGLNGVDILNLAEYLHGRKQYDYVLIDEAHNLKSFLELDEEYVKSVSLTFDDDIFVNLVQRYLLPDKKFVAQQLSFVSAKDILDNLSKAKRFRNKIKPVLINPTLWSCFVYIWRDAQLCSLIFVQNDGLCKFRIPNKHLLLFSATQLSNEELSFYCAIEPSSIARARQVNNSSSSDGKQKFCVSLKDGLIYDAKIDFIKSVIMESNVRTLVLFNTFPSCKKAFETLRKSFKNLFMIRSYSDDSNVFEAFMSQTNGVLFSSSTVFWEGVTIKGLNLVVIFEPPFPRPRLIDLVNKRSYNGSLDMTRRLRQGVGRVGRKKGELGIAVILFDVNGVGKGNLGRLFYDVKIRVLYSYQSSVLMHKVFTDKVPPSDFFS